LRPGYIFIVWSIAFLGAAALAVYRDIANNRLIRWLYVISIIVGAIAAALFPWLFRCTSLRPLLVDIFFGSLAMCVLAFTNIKFHNPARMEEEETADRWEKLKDIPYERALSKFEDEWGSGYLTTTDNSQFLFVLMFFALAALGAVWVFCHYSSLFELH